MQPLTPGTTGDALLTLDEALGFVRLSRTKFFSLLKNKQIARVRQSRRSYFWRSDLVAYLNARRIEVSGDEIVNVLAEVEAATLARQHSVGSDAA